ncbi:MAG: helix-turn-helix domain-containing protein [Fibromonadaceae bacterium]|jgi:DNA-binding XRE family transcriptional regulator|nr:helix-turn-helix domain-containing protein [Fibromonadaceae bacterium]
MQALVVVPHTLENGKVGEFRLTGNVPVFVIDLFKRLFPKMREEPVEDVAENIYDWDWWKKKTANITPGDHLRVTRTMREMKQTELAKKIGVVPRQISDMEKGRTPIGKKMAMRLGEALNMDYKHFL